MSDILGWFEQRVIQNYVSLPFGEHMGFLIGALDGDPSVVTAPALPPRPTTVNTELIKAAVAFLRRTSLSIEPESFKRDLAALTTLALTDAQQRKCVAALDGDVYEDLPKARMALVLRFESLVCAPEVQFQDTVSLEHGLPQTPPDGSDWIKWFPDEDERDGWTHRLANLVPLERNKNASASNDDCAKKKDAYFRGKGKASPFVLPQEVRSENAWTPTLLAECQQRLVGVLKDHWNLAVATGTAAS
ncbi:HNH endonuclease family protein [Xylella fastidiosa]|uniref:HNH endonuclease family protein n=1 Tax=Xylella fastidiosa subsp. multiplex TaxID=644357 RepID=A0AAW6HUB7_XYLFS|nr:HNH endonuclease family protein [Xylella fastidiosa]MCH7234326.1 HNH endonuclease family protein [Xylella fastidiosa subsp. multiplex]MCP8324373.1 HNH endonuclease family protein [Xylella fastidiosa subsp. multiplex]MDC6407732.1 HNH endonuclease family protein [Xylella fastidiosa subsp. multiplex]MDD0908959.1 HNH endonuclease family protein [Xylella fastidiosa subsp. multiplex]MDD0935300.1 HNH endonuclease family protein [Xylella fastidiosa subsp. multiplex]